MASKCKECGCLCTRCIQNDRRHSDMHLHAEIENLRQRLMERDNHIVTMETQFLNEADKFPNGELASLKDEMLIWQDKYARLYEAHKRVQKVNQNLEDKLLRIVDKCETEKGAFTKDIATLSHRLADANYTIHRLTQDNEKYRNDVNLAIQLLQCKPSNFIGQKYESLPPEVQAKVRTYIAQKAPSSESKSSDVKSITVPISTFPPTAMVYNVTRTSVSKNDDSTLDDLKPPVDVVSAAIMAKVLEDREKERIFARHCETCSCHRSVLKIDSEVQTMNTSESSTCNECQNRQDTSRGDDFAEDGDRVTDRKDNFKYDRAARQYKQIRDSYSHSIFSDVNDYSKTISKVRTQNSDSSVRHTVYQCVNEVVESKNNQKTESFKTSGRSIGSRNYSSLRNSTKHQNSLNLQNITAETKLLAPENFKGKQEEKADSVKGSKKFNHWSDLDRNSIKGRAAQVDIINERLWKSSWTTSETQDFREHGVDRRIRSGKDTQIDVINDRVWKNNNKSKMKEDKPTQLTLIEVASADESVNNSEKRPTKSTVSPSFSSDSVIFSTSDPSSISSDVIQSMSKGLSKQDKKICNTDLKASKQDRTPGPTNCLMRVSGKSNNILLDNVGNYQPVLYTNTIGIPNTAMVHATSSCRSGRTASTSSEENSSMLSSDNVQLQRVAEWVKSSVQPDKSSVPEFSKSSHHFEKSSVTKIKIIDVKHYDKVLRNEVMEIESQNLVDESKSSESLQKFTAQKKDKDLITFDPSSDEEKDLNVVSSDFSKADSSPEIDYEVKVTKEMEETYLKLTASLDPVALRLASLTGSDLTIEKYRKDHKRLQAQKTPAKSGSTT